MLPAPQVTSLARVVVMVVLSWSGGSKRRPLTTTCYHPLVILCLSFMELVKVWTQAVLMPALLSEYYNITFHLCLIRE